MNLRRWLTPGIGIKRWLLVVFAGLLLLAIAFAHFLRQVTRDFAPTGPIGGLIDLLTLQFLPFGLRGLIAASERSGRASTRSSPPARTAHCRMPSRATLRSPRTVS